MSGIDEKEEYEEYSHTDANSVNKTVSHKPSTRPSTIIK